MDDVRGIYHVQRGTELVKRTLSYSFVSECLAKLTEWGEGHGLSVKEYEANTAGAFDAYVSLRNDVEEYCEMMGITCDALLHPQLRDYEGRQMQCLKDDGSLRSFYVKVSEGLISHHLEVMKQGANRGKRAKGYYRDLRVLSD